MSAKKFLDQVEEQGLLDESIVADLRRQVAESNKPISAESVAKLLVENGHLTKFQAKKLVADAAGKAEPPAEDEDDDVVMLEPAAGGAGAGAGAAAASANDDLGLIDDEGAEDLAPLDDDAGGLQPLEDDAGGLQPLEDDGGGLQPLGDDAGGLTPLGDDAGLTPIESAPAGGLEPLDAGGGLESLDDPSVPADPFAEGGEADQAAAAQPKGPKKKLMRANPWDSPLLLAGGGGLLLLIFLALLLYFSLTRGNASDVFAKAEEDYRNQAYTQAIDKYEKFLKSYPQDPNVSLARVRINMARVRQAVEGSSDPQRGLDAAKQYLPEIQDEESFNEARLELSSLLPDIADGFAQKAKVSVRTSYADAEALLDKATESMELVDNPMYIPASLRKGQADRLRDISELVAEVRHTIDRDKKLESTLAAMREALKEDKTSEAYAQREALLQEHPGLSAHEELIEVVREITERQKGLVTNLQPPVAPQAADPEDAERLQVVLAARRGNPIPDIQGHLAYVLANGGVYGIDASTGEPLWRRYVGEAATVHPQPVSDQPGADALIVNPTDHSLLRLAARTGEVVWKLPIGEAFRAATIVDDHGYVSTASGKVYKVALATGEIAAAAQLPPGEVPYVSPGGSSGRPTVYQPGDHDNLYVLGQDQLDAEEVFYLGHEAGTIAVPPTFVLGYVLVAENAGADYTQLHIIKTNRDGLELAPAQAPLRLEGKVVVPPFVDGRRVTVVTDLGAVYVYNVNPQHEENEPPVTPAVDPLIATGDQPMVSYFKVAGTQLWVGDTRLAKYDVQVSRQKLNRQWSENVGSVFVAPIQHFGNALIQVRRPVDASGVTVSAINDNDFKQELWSLELAVPTLDVFIDGDQKVRAVSSRGSMFTVDDQAQQKRAVVAPAQSTTFPYTAAASVGDGRNAYFSPTGRLLVYDPERSSDELRALRLSLQGAEPTANPTGFAEGVLVPLDQGEVVLLDVASGTNKMLPFHPQLEAGGRRVEWLSPAPLPDTDQFAIADNRNNLFLVGANASGQAHLAEVAKATVEQPLERGLAVAGDTLYGVTRGSQGDIVVSYSLPKLEAGKKWQLQGRIHAGPFAVGDSVFVATETDGLLCLGPGQAERWKVPLPHGPLAAAPRVVGDNLLLASQTGVVWLAEAATGKELASTVIGEPLAGTPLLHQDQLYVSGADGTLHIANPPAAGN